MSERPVLKRPKILLVAAFIYALLPVIQVFHLSLLSHVKLSPFMYASVLLNTIVAYGILSTRTWGWLAYTGYSFVYLVAQTWFFVSGLLPVTSMIMVALGLGFTFFVLSRDGVRAPFFNPSLRRWDQAIRYRTPVEVRLHWGESIVDAVTVDISRSGCFVRMDFNDDDIGAPVLITLARKKMPVYAIGEVVRISHDDEVTGVGIRFLSIDPRSQENLKSLLDEVKSVADAGDVTAKVEDIEPKKTKKLKKAS